MQNRGKYRVTNSIARGGMGEVFDVQDPHLKRHVAMKILLPGLAGYEEQQQRFRREAEILARLEHPNIVPIHELNVDAPHQPFYTMKLIHGRTLRAVLDEIKADPTAREQYPLSYLLTVFQKICDAVAFAHAQGILHRDLKPENIMVGNYGEVLVADWGLAKILDETPEVVAQSASVASSSSAEAVGNDQVWQTLEGTVMGTPQYMAPEQAEGRIQELDVRTDIFGLGGILYAILTLRPPVSGSSLQEIIHKITSGQIRPPSTYPPAKTVKHTRENRRETAASDAMAPPWTPVPKALSDIAMKALAPKPADRYPTVTALQADIAAYQNGFATTAEQAGFWRLFYLAVKRRRKECLVTGIFLLVLAIMATGFTLKLAGTLAALKKAAPSIYAEAEACIDNHQFERALDKVAYALTLVPREKTYHLLQGHILQSLQRLESASHSYATVLQLDPDHQEARENLTLCRQLIDEKQQQGFWTPAMFQELRQAMIQQGRVSEAVAISAHLKEENFALDLCQKVFQEAGWEGQLTCVEHKWIHYEIHDPTLTNLAPLRGLPLNRLDISGTQVRDLTPLRGMPLHELVLNNVPVEDLSPLQGMPLRTLHLYDVPVANLQPIRDLPLEILALGGGSQLTQVRDLTPLAGMPLRHLTICSIPINDIRPLAGLRLAGLMLSGVSVADLTPLRGMPLTELFLDDTDVSDLKPLFQMPLQNLSLARTKVDDLKLLRGMSLHALTLEATRVTDLDPLAGMPLTDLSLKGTPMSRLDALRGMPLENLNLARTAITRIEPLQGMPLRRLDLSVTPINNILVLAQMPLVELRLDGCTQLRDLSPLTNCPTLQYLSVPHQATNVSCVQQLPNLKRLAAILPNVPDVWAEAPSPDAFWSSWH